MLKTLIFKEIRYDDNIEEELKLYKAKVINNSKDTEALQNLATIYHALKKDKEAISIYEQLVKLKPDDFEMRAFLGYLYYEVNDLDKAEENLSIVLNYDPMEPFILFLLGNIYSRKGEIIKAIENYEFAIFLDLDIYIAHIDFARKYENMGRFKRAIEEYKAAYDIDSRDEALKEKIAELEKECRNC
ncbi:MAG: tetratricopeptide repeat protein [Fusobacteriales bacterium]|jgi:tetratricopeptide (TPR) repeat protein|nr:tetratricopeptide repeat protein [Fusobacteriales bacterium]